MKRPFVKLNYKDFHLFLLRGRSLLDCFSGKNACPGATQIRLYVCIISSLSVSRTKKLSVYRTKRHFRSVGEFISLILFVLFSDPSWNRSFPFLACKVWSLSKANPRKRSLKAANVSIRIGRCRSVEMRGIRSGTQEGTASNTNCRFQIFLQRASLFRVLLFSWIPRCGEDSDIPLQWNYNLLGLCQE